MKSWKTTTAGIVALLAVLVKYYWPEHSSMFAEIIAVATAAGLIAARDNNVSSEQAGAK